MHALTLATQLGERWIEAQALYTLGEVELARSNASAGVGYLLSASGLFSELGSVMWQARSLVLLSEAHTAQGDKIAGRGEAHHAARLLAIVDSDESAMWLDRLRGSQSGLVLTPLNGLDR